MTREIKILLAVIASGILISAIPLAEFYFGGEILSIDMTFYWDVARRHFFETYSYWWDACDNGYSLLSNPIYGIFSALNAPHLFLKDEVARRATVVLFYAVLAAGTFLWLRLMGYRKRESFATVLLLCASGLISGMVFRNKPYLFPIAILPVCGAFAAAALLTASKRAAWIWSAMTGIAIGTAALSGDPIAAFYALITIVATHLSLATSGRCTAPYSAQRLFLYPIAGIASVITAGFTFKNILEVVQISMRGQVMPASEALAFSFHPIRLIEFIFPVFGIHGTASFTGSQYTSALKGASFWWYPDITFGPVASILLVAGAVYALRKKENLPFLITAAVLMFISFGKWNPAVKSFIETFPAMRMIRYPAKAVLPAAILAIPLVCQAWSNLFSFLQKHCDDQKASRIFVGILAFGTLMPALMTPKYSIAGIHRDITPEILTPLGTTTRSKARVVIQGSSNMDKKIRGDNNLIFVGTPLFWDVKSFGCPEATKSIGQILKSGGVFSAKEMENLGATHIFRPPYDADEDATEVKSGEFTVAATTKEDGFLLLAASRPPPRFKLVHQWSVFPFVRRPDSVSMTPPDVFVMPTIYIDGRGKIRPISKSNAEFTLNSPESAASCSGDLNGTFDDLTGHGAFSTSSECAGLLLVNARFVNGWTAAVNGSPTPIAFVNESMIGIPVPAGHAKIDLNRESGFIFGFPYISLILQLFAAVGALSLPFTRGFKLVTGH